MMVLEGMPLVLLELAAGQKFRQGAYGVWNMIHPWLGGIGVGSTVIAVIVGCYYNMIIAWCIYYLINSFWVRGRASFFSLFIFSKCKLPPYTLAGFDLMIHSSLSRDDTST
jgi:SNF family Na+-dependent transporter